MTEERKNCPFCGKEISSTAKKCIHCGQWLDETIKCPTCGETINASAKICRFCKEPVKKQANMNLPKLGNIDYKSKPFIVGVCSAVACLLALMIFNLMYVPNCSSPSVLGKVKKNIQREVGKSSAIIFGTEKIKEIRKDDDGYSCSTPVLLDGMDTSVYYKYTKNGFKISLDSNFMLPDCFSETAKNMVLDIVQKSYKEDGIDDRIKSVDLDIITSNTDKKKLYEAEKIECTGTIKAMLKPGWTYGNKDHRTNEIDYSIYFCNNEYTPCATVYNERNYK